MAVILEAISALIRPTSPSLSNNGGGHEGAFLLESGIPNPITQKDAGRGDFQYNSWIGVLLVIWEKNPVEPKYNCSKCVNRTNFTDQKRANIIKKVKQRRTLEILEGTCLVLWRFNAEFSLRNWICLVLIQGCSCIFQTMRSATHATPSWDSPQIHFCTSRKP